MESKSNYLISGTSESKSTKKPDFLNFAEILCDGKKFVIDLKEEMAIDEEQIIESMIKHAGNYGWWVGAYSTVRRALRQKRRELDRKKSELDYEARSDLKHSGHKVTEAAVQAWITTDPRSKEGLQEVLNLEDLVEYVELVLKSLEHKRDMLKEINRNLCNEAFNIKKS